jgi:hypothetical protein
MTMSISNYIQIALLALAAICFAVQHIQFR